MAKEQTDDEKLTYDELKLGEKAQELWEKGASPKEIMKQPTYLNTRKVFGNLTATDMVRAAVLGGVNVLLVGDTGTGKSQLAKDIYNNYFGGNIAEQGQGVWIRGRPDIDIYSEIFTQVNIKKAQRELTKNIAALIYTADEINRCPKVQQNQFFGLGDGSMDAKGQTIVLGQNDYHVLIATANIGNGEFGGTWGTDKALYNRLHTAIDFDYEMFQPTDEDEMLIDILKAANPNVKEAPKRDISKKIIAASKKIDDIAQNPGLEALAVMNYLRFGLRNCQKYGKKEKIWPTLCQDCDKNPAEESLCSLIRSPRRRTQHAVMRYASSLHYLTKLKNPGKSVSTIDLMFKVFELTAAYQMLLNPKVLGAKYHDQNPKMIAEVVKKLKDDFKKNEDFIMASLVEADNGREVTQFFEHDGTLGPYQDLNEESRGSVSPIEPYNNDRLIGMGWVPKFIKFRVKQKKRESDESKE